MARAYRGPYAAQSTYEVPYATASVWGTGIDAIHSYYGEGPPLRTLGRDGTIGSSPVANIGPQDREYQNPANTSGMDPPQEVTWGYAVDYSPDSFGSGADSPISYEDTAPATYQEMGGRPSWDTPPEGDLLRQNADTMPSWGTSGLVMRAIRAGSHRLRVGTGFTPHGADAYQPVTAEPSNSNPTETVSEGWLNKVTSFVAHSEPSDPSTIFVQTSQRQRFGTRDNTRAVMRATDDERSKISSRVMAMIEKSYSGGERHYDMAPYQIDQIERPFRYRTAGVGAAEWMEANEYSAVTPVQRTPPPDPSAGAPEVSSAEYGYTGEDTMYYG